MSSPVKPDIVLFDLYRTLIDIETVEHAPEVWERLTSFLRYSGLEAEAGTMHARFEQLCADEQRNREEAYPETDVLRVFTILLSELGYAGPPAWIAEMTRLFRSLTIVRFGLYWDTMPALQTLRRKFRLGVVSDAQRVFLEPEMRLCGIESLFDAVVVSSDHGFHKPDPRLFRIALDRLGGSPDRTVYVGNSIETDICGARKAGIHAVWLDRKRKGWRASDECEPDDVVHSLEELARRLMP